MKNRPVWRRRLLRLAVGLVVAFLVTWGSMLALMHRWVAKEPPLPDTPAILALTPEIRDDRVYLGRSWLGHRQGLPVLYLTGTPFELGYANGVLTQKQIHRQEDAIVVLVNQVAPYDWMQFTLKFFVTWKNRRMPANITQALQMEMLGIARGCPDAHPQLGPYFNRVLNYHAAQDISYMLMNSPLIRGGCTAFGAWGDSTERAHLLCGRNFDWEADPVFDEERMVIFCEPDDGIPFVSVAWAGMAGCVSGLNRDGLSITVNGAPSELPASAGTPTCLIAREVLQNARNLAEAVEIIRRRSVFVSAMFLIGSRSDGRFIVVEKTPEATAVREPEDGATSLICANHYLTPEFKDTPINKTYERADTSLSRFDRAHELLKETTRRLDAAACVDILRDRRLPGGQFAGNGHRGSLNPLIATHSTVMDLTAGILWAAKPPHQLGEFIPFDVTSPERLLPLQTLSADPTLSNGGHTNYLAAKTNLNTGWRALKEGEIVQALEFARLTASQNPGFYQGDWLLAEILFHQNKVAESAEACRRALAGRPALESERRRIEDLLGRTAETR